MKMHMEADRLTSAIVLIVCGVLQTLGWAFPLWLVVICMGLMIMMNRA